MDLMCSLFSKKMPGNSTRIYGMCHEKQPEPQQQYGRGKSLNTPANLKATVFGKAEMYNPNSRHHLNKNIPNV